MVQGEGADLLELEKNNSARQFALTSVRAREEEGAVPPNELHPVRNDKVAMRGAYAQQPRGREGGVRGSCKALRGSAELRGVKVSRDSQADGVGLELGLHFGQEVDAIAGLLRRFQGERGRMQ